LDTAVKTAVTSKTAGAVNRSQDDAANRLMAMVPPAQTVYPKQAFFLNTVTSNRR